MAKRGRKRKRKYSSRSYQTSTFFEDLNFDLELDPKVVREIASILMVGLGLFILLSILGLAGSVGGFFYNVLRLGFGWTSFALPVVLIGSGIAMFYPIRYNFK